MSTHNICWWGAIEYHNICFCGEIRKIIYGYPLLTGAMSHGRYLSQRMLKPTIVWPAKIQISLYIHTVWQRFSFIPVWITGGCRKLIGSAETLIRFADVQADLSLRWLHKSYCRFYCALAHLYPEPKRQGFQHFTNDSNKHSFVEIDHEIFSTVILSLPLIQEGQLSVSGERMCTILVNRLED